MSGLCLGQGVEGTGFCILRDLCLEWTCLYSTWLYTDYTVCTCCTLLECTCLYQGLCACWAVSA